MDQGTTEQLNIKPEAIQVKEHLPRPITTEQPNPIENEPQEVPKSDEKQRIEEIRNKLAETATQTHVEKQKSDKFDSVFYSVDNYFGKNNRNKTGYAILGYEAMEPITFWKTIIDSAKKHLPCPEDRQNMADVGCAYGYLLKHISADFAHTFGLDISRTALEKAKVASPSSELIETDLNQESIPLADNSMDMITVLDAVEHVAKPDALLSQVYTKLRDGGIAVISTPDVGNWLGKLIAKANGDPSHINLFAQKDMVVKLENLGFEILEKHSFFPLGPFRVPIPANIEIVARKKSKP
jgi:2-polyprenyl-3-methyl-5-hydroxy-6-metoxy-1,4-benzoquinol methylase